MEKITLIFSGREQAEWETSDLPSPGVNQLLVKTTHTLISTGTETIAFTRNFAPDTHWDNWVTYPFYPGYLNVGKVIEIGSEVHGWKIGDRIAARAKHTSHYVIGCPKAHHVPDNVSNEDAVWMGLGKITQIGVRAAEHRLGDKVVVVGLGLLGQLVVQYARLFGAGEIIAIDMIEDRLKMAKSHGATQVIQQSVVDARQSVLKITNGIGADVVYDVTGSAKVFADALSLAKDFGTIVLLGDTGSPRQQTLTSEVIQRGLHIVGAHDMHASDTTTRFAGWSSAAIHDLFLSYVSRGLITCKDLITHRFNYQQAEEVYANIVQNRQSMMRILLEWN